MKNIKFSLFALASVIIYWVFNLNAVSILYYYNLSNQLLYYLISFSLFVLCLYFIITAFKKESDILSRILVILGIIILAASLFSLGVNPIWNFFQI